MIAGISWMDGWGVKRGGGKWREKSHRGWYVGDNGFPPNCNNSLMSPLFQAGSSESNINDQQGCVNFGGKSIFVTLRSNWVILFPQFKRTISSRTPPNVSCLLFKSSVGSRCVTKIFNESLLKSLLKVNASNCLRGNAEVSHIRLASLQQTAFSLGLRIRSNHLSVGCDKSRWHLVHTSPQKTQKKTRKYYRKWQQAVVWSELDGIFTLKEEQGKNVSSLLLTTGCIRLSDLPQLWRRWR